MAERYYSQPEPVTDEEIAQVFQHGDTHQISETLVAIALYDPDWGKIQTYCLQYLEHPDAGVRSVAATCIGHLARIHQHMDLDIVLPALYRHQSDQGKYVAGNVDNALSCIERFMHIPVERDPAMRPEPRPEPREEAEIDEDDEEEERPLTDEEIEQGFASGDALTIERTLMALAYRHPDWCKTETYCLHYLHHPDDNVRETAAECISILIYQQHHLDVEPARAALLPLRSDISPYVVKKVYEALSDIDRFVRTSAQSDPATQETHQQPPEQGEQGEEMDKQEETPEEIQEPTNGQRALDNSVSVLSGPPRRIGIDLIVGEIVIFKINNQGRYGGNVRTWQQLAPEEKEALIDNGLIDQQGTIILRDARGNIIGAGKNVIDPTEKTATTETEQSKLTTEEIERAFASDDILTIERTLLALALHDPDWRRTEDYCIRFLNHPDSSIRSLAAECISHLIYNQHHLDVKPVRKALLPYRTDANADVTRKVFYALSDIALFVRQSAS